MKTTFRSIDFNSSSRILAGALLLLSTLFSVQAARADGAGNPDLLTDVACMQTTADFGLGCTANDVSLASASNITILDDGCALPGDDVTFTADFEVLLTAQARHDVGIWFASDGDGNGDGALTGVCTVLTPAYAPDPPWLDLDGTNDDPNGVVQDTCGDINADHNPLFPSVTLTVACIDPDGDGLLNLPYCTSWRQPGANELCTSPLDAFPGAPSKCKCDTGFTLDIPVPFTGTIEVMKELVPATSPGVFNLQIDQVTQAADATHLGTTGAVSVSAGISNDPLPIGDTHTVGETAGTGSDLADYDTAISCEDEDGDTASDTNAGPVDVFVEPDDAWVCTITNTLRNTDLAISKSDDPDPVEAGGTLTYTITVDNLGLIDAENVKVTESLPAGVVFDSTSGCVEDPTGVPTCSLGTIAAGGSASYTVTVTVNGDVPDQTVLTNSVSVASDTPDENPANDTATEDTTVLNNPALSIVKTATPTTYDSVGDVISYSYLVKNVGNVTISGPITVADDKATDESCPAGDLAPNAETTCTASYTISQADLDAGSVTNTAFASGFAPGGNPVNSPTDDETVTAEQSPALSIVKTATPTTYDSVGDVISYSYLVKNVGNVTISGPITVADDKATDESCPAGDLAPNAETTCTASYTITQADLDAGSVTNIATASGTDPNGQPVTSPPDDETVNAEQNPALSIVKTATPSTYDSVGDVISYSYLVKNVGNVTISGPITVADDKATDESCPAGDLAPNAETTCTASYTITQADLDAGSVTNIATASGTDPNGQPVTSPPDDETVNAEQNPALSIVKTATPSTYDSVGDVISYSYLVKNVGNVTISGPITVADDKATDESCPAGDLAPNGETTCTASYTITQADLDAGFVTNVATASGTDPNGQPVTSPPDDETVNAEQNPALSIVKTATPSTYDSVGDVISYSYLVKNVGNVTISGPITVADDKATDESCPAGDLAPNGETTCTASYTITQADLDAGFVTNVATASGTDPNGQPVTSPPDDETVNAEQNPALSIVKTATPSTYDSVGDVISYSYLVKNVGNVTISGPITVADDKATDESCPAGDLAPNGETTCTASYTITQADLDAGFVTNVATASGTDPNGQPVTSPPDDETVNAEQNPALSIVKTATPSTYDSVGDVISYSYLVKNVGNVTISGPITVADDKATDESCPAGDLAPNGETTCTASYTITQADLDAGFVTNVATASGTDPNGQPVTSPPDDETVNAEQNPALSIVKTATPSTYDSVGDVISYSYLVKNVGNVTISGPITVADDKATDESCPAGDLAPNAETTCTASYTITQADLDAGSVTNIATASGTDPNGQPVTSPPDDETVNAEQNPALSIVKTATPSTYDSVGDVISYSYLVKNVGNVTISGPITVADDKATDESCPAGDLAPNAETTCTASYTITQADLDAGSVTNIATASGTDPNGQTVTSPPDDETVNAIQNPEITLAKSGTFNDENDDGFADAGETISYSFTVTNTGNVTLTDISITDPGVTVSGGPIASLAPGASDSSTFTGSYTITQADVDAGTFYNLAEACADDPNDVETCDDDDHDEPLPQNPAISIDKSPDEQTIAQGTAASFTIEVSNDGNVTLTNVTVSDPLAPECDRQFASIAVGSFEQYSCIVTDVTGNFTNVATADSAETGPDSDTADVLVIPITEFCEDNEPPTALLMQYSGLDSSVYIVVEHAHDGVIFSGTVADGGTFILEREDDGGNVKLNPELDVYIYASQGGALIDRIDIHTSCSLPLYVGQMFGTNLNEAKVTLLGEVVFGGDPDAIEPSDILWRNSSTGENQFYEMDGFNIVAVQPIQTVSDLNWKIVGRGDYNGGGLPDILWRNEVTGQNWMYLMNGDKLILSAEVNKVIDVNWKIVGNGDFDGDGRSDILWRHEVTGQNWMYLMNGPSIMASLSVTRVSNLDWKIVGGGDYNGDGRSDILWRNAVTGQNWLFLMDGSTVVGSSSVLTTLPILEVAGSGDYNGDGKSDILWRNPSTGQNWLFFMDGSTILSSVGVITVGTDWKVVGSGDYDGDGKSDILWRNSSTGQNWLFLMDGNSILNSQLVNVEDDLYWKVINTN